MSVSAEDNKKIDELVSRIEKLMGFVLPKC